VVARRVARDIAGRRPNATFDGSGSCFVELGGGVAAYATGDFYVEEGPRVLLRRPGRRYHPGQGRLRALLDEKVVQMTEEERP